METWEFFSKTAGEAYVTQVSGFQSDVRGVMNNYMDNRGAQVVKQARVDLMDLKDQREGEAHVFFKSSIIRASMFYADPPHCKVMRLNQFLKVEQPDQHELYKLVESMDRFTKAISKPEIFPEAVSMDEFLERYIDEFHKADAAHTPIERAVIALKSFYESAVPQLVEEALPVPETELNIFTDMRNSVYLNNLLLTANREEFIQPILPFTPTREQTAYVERVLGKTDQYSNSISGEIMKDIQMATHYPPELRDMPSAAELTASVDALIAGISTIKSGTGTDEEVGGIDTSEFLD
jgi:intracellular multiplication protein IcmO